MSSPVIILKPSDLGIETSKRVSDSGLKKKDIKLLAEILGVEFPIKKKEDKKSDSKSHMGMIETAVLIAIGTYFAGLLQMLAVHEFLK